MVRIRQAFNKCLFKNLQIKLPMKPGRFSVLSYPDYYMTAIFIYNNLSIIRQNIMWYIKTINY